MTRAEWQKRHQITLEREGRVLELQRFYVLLRPDEKARLEKLREAMGISSMSDVVRQLIWRGGVDMRKKPKTPKSKLKPPPGKKPKTPKSKLKPAPGKRKPAKMHPLAKALFP